MPSFRCATSTFACLGGCSTLAAASLEPPRRSCTAPILADVARRRCLKRAPLPLAPPPCATPLTGSLTAWKPTSRACAASACCASASPLAWCLWFLAKCAERGRHRRTCQMWGSGIRDWVFGFRHQGTRWPWIRPRASGVRPTQSAQALRAHALAQGRGYTHTIIGQAPRAHPCANTCTHACTQARVPTRVNRCRSACPLLTPIYAAGSAGLSCGSDASQPRRHA